MNNEVRIKQIQDLFEEFHACYGEMDSRKFAVAAWDIARETCSMCGEHKSAWREVQGEEHKCMEVK